MKDFFVVVLIFIAIIFLGRGIKYFGVYHMPQTVEIDKEIEDWQPFR